MVRNERALAALTALMLGCGGSHAAVNYSWSGHDRATNEDVTVTRGPMPTAETFAGVYHSEQIGDVQVEQTGDSVVASYEYDLANCHIRGTLDGRIEGNLWHFTWSENHRACGRLVRPTGHGYFLFWKDSQNNGRMTGEWGYNDDEAGRGRWQCFRMPNQRPHVRIGDDDGSSGGASNSSNSSSSSSSSSSNSGSGTGSSGSTPAPTGDPLQGL